jgi:hypothetical protein
MWRQGMRVSSRFPGLDGPPASIESIAINALIVLIALMGEKSSQLAQNKRLFFILPARRPSRDELQGRGYRKVKAADR